MSQFPDLKPASRSFTPGTIPVSTFQAMSGREMRVILGDTMHGHILQLSFSNIQEAVAKAVLIKRDAGRMVVEGATAKLYVFLLVGGNCCTTFQFLRLSCTNSRWMRAG